ncbi:MAG: rRNA maturation RNase YbeY [Limisphaerales bacterium]
MKLDVVIRNRQRTFRVDGRRLRKATEDLLDRELGLAEANLGIHLIGSGTMAAMNWRWLRHEGSTDILTFDHRSNTGEPMHGELFISLEDAAAQASVYGTTTDAELARYVIHGVLHLLGYDDVEPAARAVMKRVENRLVRRVMAGGHFADLVRRKPGSVRKRAGSDGRRVAGARPAGKRSR